MTWIDISMPLRNGMDHWPDDPPVEIHRLRAMAAGADYNLTTLSMSAHTGTHIDAPLHFIVGGASLDQMPVDTFVGPAVVVQGTSAPVSRSARVLFRCGTEITPDTAQELVDQGVRAVGIDSLTIGNYETHRILLAAGIWIVEGLDLSSIAPGQYELLCLPLRIEGADGSPARALVRAII